VVELSYLPGAVFEGVVSYIYPFLDPKTRTARVRIEIDNAENVLKPDMFANVRIEAETRKDVLVVPDEAVLRSGRRSLVIVALGGGRFAPREVTPGLESGTGLLEIRAGLREEEKIVTSGQFLIDSESRLHEAARKLLGSGAGEGATARRPVVDHGDHVMPTTEAAPDPSGHEMSEPGVAPDHSGHAVHEMED
jgi:multidrug efflux pump subunit AcrA (membrane-fusion protein)